jgi:Spy/CpxP family protein refolding chaperone
MRKLSLIAALALGGLVACSTLATAQNASSAPEKKGGKRGMSVDQMMERYTEQLSLTDEQKPKVKKELEDSLKKRHEISRDSSLDQHQKRDKFREVMAAQTKKMKEILNPDQYKKYQEMNEKMKKGGRKKRSE